jgi:hypothetical protein
MLRVISSKLAQNKSWLRDLDDVEWFGPLEPFDRPGQRPVENIDEPPEEGRIDETNYTDFLADDLDDADQAEEAPESFLDELPLGDEGLLTEEEPHQVEYSDPIDLVNDGRANQEVISFEYVNRHGAYAGRRTVEPHYMFPARTTGNLVLVGWDRGVDDIRAFIIGQTGGPAVNKETDPSAGIQPGGVRYENEKFEWRPEIVLR